MDAPQPPEGFISLREACETKPGQMMNLIGVCTDFKNIIQSGGPDLTMTVDLHDPSWSDGTGLEVRFFYPNELYFPKVTNTGDIVVVSKVKKVPFRGNLNILSNKSTSWTVFEHDSVRDSKCANGSDIKFHLSVKPTTASTPSVALLRYAKAILLLENQANWRAPLITPHPTEDASNGALVQVTRSSDRKFSLISDARVTPGSKGIFYDFLGEVRRIWHSQNTEMCELHITDYTENNELFNYANGKSEEQAGHDYGDQFGYVDNSHSTWPGPWGKMTLLVSCWPPHCSFVVKNIEPGDYVSLRNVQITYDRDGTKLEGHCRTDQHRPQQVNVQILKKAHAEKNEKFKDLLRRKREYEDYCKTEGIPFVRNARTTGRRNKDKDEEDLRETSHSKSKKKRKKDKKAQRARGGANSREAGADITTAITKQPPSLKHTTNPTIRSKNLAINVTPIATILSSDILERKTPNGNVYRLPFQNMCYKSCIRVVNYSPDNLEDFCAPIRDSEYACLSDGQSASDVDLEDENLPIGMNSDGLNWEWRFVLLVEDAKPTPGPEDGSPKQMELLVSGDDGTYLLRQDPCNLRQNKQALVKLKEKLFHLWGDLQEQKEEIKANASEREGAELMPSGIPFECFIKEYGVPAEDEAGKEDEKVERWERMWRMCMTTIADV